VKYTRFVAQTPKAPEYIKGFPTIGDFLKAQAQVSAQLEALSKKHGLSKP
jgi:hypothetical protein